MFRLMVKAYQGWQCALTDFAPIGVKASRFPAALYCSRLSKYYLYHTAHTPVLTLTAHGL
jgi:hypothetical protein